MRDPMVPAPSTATFSIRFDMIRVLSPTRVSFHELNQQLALGCGWRISRLFYVDKITILNCPTTILTKTPTRKRPKTEAARVGNVG
jgi:hypothetical protein